MPKHQPLDRRALQRDEEQKVLERVYDDDGMSKYVHQLALDYFLISQLLMTATQPAGFPTICLQFVQKA